MKKLFISFFEKLNRDKWLVLILILLSLVTRFYHFGRPNQIVFDEVYFPKFVTSYFKGEYYFDIHPPLAKLLMAGWAKISQSEAPISFDFKNIGKEYPNDFYKTLRFLTSLCGAFLPLAIYFLSREMFSSKMAAFLAGFFVVFDNAFLTQSRFILTDVFLLTFGALGLGFLFRHFKKKEFSISWFVLLFLAFLFLSAAFAVKWTGLIFLGVAGLAVFRDFIRDKKLSVFAVRFVLGFFVFFAFYFFVFAIHFSLLPYSGEGDAFMSKNFQTGLVGNANYKEGTKMPLIKKFFELNSKMLSANAGITATHSYGSRWTTWPFMYRPIYYWFGGENNSLSSRIYFIGNPFLWWLSFSSVFMAFFLWLKEVFNKGKNNDFWMIFFLLAGYFGNLAAYFFVSRVSFLYHYLPSLLFAFVLAGYLMAKNFRYSKKIILFIMVLTILVFIFFTPLSYGLPMAKDSFEKRIWFPSWE